MALSRRVLVRSRRSINLAGCMARCDSLADEIMFDSSRKIEGVYFISLLIPFCPSVGNSYGSSARYDLEVMRDGPFSYLRQGIVSAKEVFFACFRFETIRGRTGWIYPRVVRLLAVSWLFLPFILFYHSLFYVAPHSLACTAALHCIVISASLASSYTTSLFLIPSDFNPLSHIISCTRIFITRSCTAPPTHSLPRIAATVLPPA
ncbi:hypothetical protein M441DRAFT_408626 [Trichoderma asperellum CBS 433.97]|uniref:Uncharacterized protein n=1 Tax=Trichoderma asperellum (strain ATCC 204424 / CBS 433.97 / NBRC 101777) TaxID=1042311 RepID=A0A2T3Z6Z5_TRIA4|nr:hypothetical protein M441DRAFT_408626 [Trichoderma asperellum CBS 433.97]PTB40587.1 hypothetical protein M441DRAFT_408626 [Trichoderma asperellum CBS 433.97]